MVNFFIYAKDYSGSTRGVDFYHKNGLKTLKKFKKDVGNIKKELLTGDKLPTESKIVYLHWGDSECLEIDEDRATEAYLCQEGYWGTDPSSIIHWLKEESTYCENDTIKLLYIITDGEIPDRAVDNCFIKNKDIHYEKVVFHAFNKNLNQINLSVAASFLKSYCMIYRNNKLYDSVDISLAFDYDKINLDNFETEKEQLKSYIKLKYIGKIKQDNSVLEEIEKLKKLRIRLFQELSSKLISKTVKIEKCKINLETKDRNVFMQEFVNTDWYKNLNSLYNLDKAEIEKSISTLINYIVSDAKSYSFDALKFDKKFDKSVGEEQIADIESTTEQEIEFPDVILDDEKGIPVVILTEFNLMDKIIFHKTKMHKDRSHKMPWYNRRHNRKRPTKPVIKTASYSKFESAMECPLYLVNDQDISKSIGYFYTLNVYKQLLANNTKTDPRTRKPFHGGLVLTDTDQFDKYNDYILSVTYLNGKKVNYNVGLFYFVLWKNCENKNWMDKNVVEQFKKYAMRRIRETRCRIGLSSLPMDPQVKTSLLTALWYCVELSSCIFKNDPRNFKQERLRRYYNVASHMIEILKHFDYDLDLESIEKRRELISEVMILKKIRKRREKVYYLLEKIFKTVDGFLVSEIEKPFNLYKLNYLKFNHKEILRDDVVEQKVHLNDFIHLMYFEGTLDASKAGEGTFEICKKTFRPFYAIEHNKSFYEELVKNTRKVVIINDDDPDKIEVAYEAIYSLQFDKILSRYKLYIDCVKEIVKYPTLSAYVKYVSKKKKFNGNLVTIFPPNIYFDLENVHKCYRKVVKKVSKVEEFIEVCKICVNRTERIKTEAKVLFNNENDIKNFISCEESKVKLKKRI